MLHFQTWEKIHLASHLEFSKFSGRSSTPSYTVLLWKNYHDRENVVARASLPAWFCRLEVCATKSSLSIYRRSLYSVSTKWH